MKKFLTTILSFGCLMITSQAQYEFQFLNPEALTRIGSIDGPFAGPDIWAQMAAGLTPDSLSPLGSPARHFPTGLVYGEIITVPGADVWGRAYVQMFAWDGQMWGDEFDLVPAEWLGSTDVVPVSLGGDYGAAHRPIGAPRFTQPAVVPVPEPSTAALAVLGGVLLMLLRWLGHRTLGSAAPHP